MDFAAIVEAIPTLGFPIVLVLILCGFIYKIYQDIVKDKATLMKTNEENMAKVQARCQEREDKLYKYLDDTRATNDKFAEIIAKHEEKLTVIQNDVNDIKTVVMTHHQN